jgi:hypothetical protein
VICPGALRTGHPLARQSVRVNLLLPPLAATGRLHRHRGHQASACSPTGRPPRAASPAYTATFTSVATAFGVSGRSALEPLKTLATFVSRTRTWRYASASSPSWRRSSSLSW